MTVRIKEEFLGEPSNSSLSSEPGADGACSARLRRARGAGRCLALVALTLLLGLAVAAGVLCVALARGPLASDWLVPKIVESLDELYGHRYQFELGAAALANSDHGLTLTVDGLSVRSEGRTLVAAPRAELSLNWRSLLVGRLTPSRFEVLDLELRLAVMDDGQLSVAAGTDPVAIPLEARQAREAAEPWTQEPLALRASWLAQASAGLRAFLDFATGPDSPIGAVDRIGVAHGRLVIDDRIVGRTIGYEDFSLSLRKSAGAASLSVSATGAAGRWAAWVSAEGAPGESRVFDARVHNVSLDEIALVSGLRNPGFDTDAPLSFSAHVMLGSDDRVIEASGGFGAGAGYVRLDDPNHEPVMIDGASAVARWDAAARRFLIEPAMIESAGQRLRFKALATPPALAGGAWIVSAALAEPANLLPQREGERAFVVERATLDAKFFQADQKVAIEKLEIVGPEINVVLRAAAGLGENSWIQCGLELRETPVRAALQLWPSHIAAPARAWLDKRAVAGVFRSGSLALDFDKDALAALRYERPAPDTALRADFEVAGASLIELLPGLPPLNELAGRGHVSGRAASFHATAGVLETGPERRLSLAEGFFLAPQTWADPAPAAVDMRLSGDVEAAADILALETVARHASLPIDPGALKGRIEGRLRVDFEIGAKAGDKPQLTVDANASNLLIERFAGKEPLEGAAFDLVSDQAGLRVTGAGRLYGAPVILDVRRPPGAKGEAQAQLSLVFDEAARARMGFGFSGVTGPVSASVATKLPFENADAQVELDLTKASLDNPLPGVTKPAGRSGKLSFNLLKKPDGLVLDQLSAEAGFTQVSGAVELTRDGAFRSAKLSQLRLSPGDDARLEAIRNGDGLKLVVRGVNVDARPLMQYFAQPSLSRAGAGPGKPPLAVKDIDLDFKSPIVSGHNKQILTGVDLKFESRGGKPRLLTLSGAFTREPLAAALARDSNGAPQIALSTTDGGSLLSFLDLYQRMESGALTATVSLGQGRWDGSLQIHDLYLKNEPAIRRLIVQGAVRADDRGVAHFDPDSVRFTRVQAGFSWADGRLTLREGVMSGPEIGLTGDGFIDLARDSIDISGSFVPAYGLNSLVSNIPVLGAVLAGGRHEGVFAVNFRVAGPYSAPTLTVNPLSVMTPGLLRKVFGIVDGTTRLPEPAARP